MRRSKALQARNAKAQGDALGWELTSLQSAEGAKYQPSVKTHKFSFVSTISRL